MEEYKGFVDYIPLIGGVLSLIGLYAMAIIKGTIDMENGRDTFFSRAIIPNLKKYDRKSGEHQITNEVEFQELLRKIREDNFQKQNSLESEVKGASE